MSVGRTHIVAATAQKSLGCLCIVRSFQTIQLTDFNNPAIGYGFYFLLIATGERERVVKPLSTNGLEKGAFPDTLRTGQGQYVVKLATGTEYTCHSRHKPQFCLFPDKRIVLSSEIIYDGCSYTRLSVPCLLRDEFLYRIKTSF